MNTLQQKITNDNSDYFIKINLKSRVITGTENFNMVKLLSSGMAVNSNSCGFLVPVFVCYGGHLSECPFYILEV